MVEDWREFIIYSGKDFEVLNEHFILDTVVEELYWCGGASCWQKVHYLWRNCNCQWKQTGDNRVAHWNVDTDLQRIRSGAHATWSKWKDSAFYNVCYHEIQLCFLDHKMHQDFRWIICGNIFCTDFRLKYAITYSIKWQCCCCLRPDFNFLQTIRPFFPFDIIPPLLHTYSFISDW